MGLFGDEALLQAKNDLIAAQAGEIQRLSDQVAKLQTHVLALADERVLRAVEPPPPKPPAEQRPPLKLRTRPWVQSLIGGGHLDITAERQRITRRGGNYREPAPTTAPDTSEKPS